MNLIIERLNGAIYHTSDYGIKVLDFRVSSPSPRTVTEVIEGRDGYIDLGTTYEGREITAEFYVKTTGLYDFASLRNDIFRIFQSRETFYVRDDREPERRWRVKCDSAFSIEQLRDTSGKFSVTFVSDSPYAESVSTTLERSYLAEGVEYTHNTSSFFVFNAGDVPIDPRQVPLVITYKGPSFDLKIRNLTTGDEWQHYGASFAGDVFEINGVRSLRNGLSVFAKTNKRLITLDVGWNEIVVTGTSGTYETSFDFRFYSL